MVSPVVNETQFSAIQKLLISEKLSQQQEYQRRKHF